MRDSQGPVAMDDFSSVLLGFADLLGIASLCARRGQEYEMQRELALRCRAAARPFFTTMPVRHRARCTECGSEWGESELHFEDPRHVPPRVADIEGSLLHRIVVHGSAPPDDLAAIAGDVS
jgi:hypothetical protein